MPIVNPNEGLKFCRDNPGSTVKVVLPAFTTKIFDMKGPKKIRFNASIGDYEGARNGSWSKLDKHWQVITAPGVKLDTGAAATRCGVPAAALVSAPANTAARQAAERLAAAAQDLARAL